MRVLKISGKTYCIADDGFVYEELEKRISDTFHLRKDSFAEFYTKRIFQSFFQYARNLKNEYMAYYRQEYDNFADYLYKKELLDLEYIDDMNLGERQTLLKLNTRLTSYNADNLIEYDEEKGIEILNKALKEIGL
ncbi:MAG: hypothetical protein GXY49_08845 [Syntrophomonadaceae bacterium]|nr:hypothetical protein [Syntrophomonadaceae bacterium]